MTTSTDGAAQTEREQMEAAGFVWDPARGSYPRWAHARTGVTALRQPYMSDEQRAAHRLEKLAEAQALEARFCGR